MNFNMLEHGIQRLYLTELTSYLPKYFCREQTLYCFEVVDHQGSHTSVVRSKIIAKLRSGSG